VIFDVEIDGAATTVAVESDGPGRYRVVFDGAAHQVHAERAGEFGLSLGSARSGGAASTPGRALQIAPGSATGEMLVTFRGRTVPVIVNGRSRTRGAPAEAGRAGRQPVVAPMPGRVVRVLVNPGDQVTARQGVVVVEAMKMENELRSPKGGTVREVSVTPGTSVEAGRVLVVIE
jgi:acetyl/propionyl-CoA carboxylase alpha subunit